MAFLKWFLDFKNGPPFLSFGGFQKRGAIFFLVFGFWDEEPAKKTKTPFLFLFLTSLLGRPKELLVYLEPVYLSRQKKQLVVQNSLFFFNPLVSENKLVRKIASGKHRRIFCFHFFCGEDFASGPPPGPLADFG